MGYCPSPVCWQLGQGGQDQNGSSLELTELIKEKLKKEVQQYEFYSQISALHIAYYGHVQIFALTECGVQHWKKQTG